LVNLIPLGLLSLMLFHYIHFHDPLAFFTVQGAWHGGSATLMATIWGALRAVTVPHPLSGYFDWRTALDLVMIAFGLVMAFAVAWRLGDAYALVSIASVLVPLTRTTWSMSRYVLVIFPIFMLLAWWGRNPAVDKALTISFSVLLGLFSAMYVNWVFFA
jgi:hypothetical protein